MRGEYEEIGAEGGSMASTSSVGGLPGSPPTPKSLQSLGHKILSLSSEIVSRSPLVRALLACIAFAGALAFVYESWLGTSHKGFGIMHFILVLAFASYAYNTEFRRLPRKTQEVKDLRGKCRKLVQARRAAGLLRLEKDTRLRREHWPAPPHSGLKAYLYKESSLDLESVESPMKRRELDYRRLCTQIAREALVSAKDGGPANLSKALFRLLSQAGPEPVKDPDLYKDMHHALDVIEDQLGRGDKEPSGFYCRLCLGYQNADRKSGVTLKCGHTICKECSLSLVDSSLSGAIGVPISCPVGCNSLMSPQMLRSSLSDDTFDRFQRIHTVKMSLQASAPHVRSLASELAEARKGLLMRSTSKEKGSGSGRPQQGSATELKLRISLHSDASSSGSRFADPSSRLNHRTRLR